MPKTPYETAPSIFLDTNVIHNCASYLILAQGYKLPPFAPAKDISEVQSILKKDMPEGIVGHLTKGLATLTYLQGKIKEKDARCYTSRLSIAEMWNGRLDGMAHIRMSLSRIPYRQRQRPTDFSQLVSMRLTQQDYDTVNNELENILTTWNNELGIVLSFVEDEVSGRDLHILALEIQKLTFLDVIDCTIFAGSLALLATEFITTDIYLRDVIGNLRNPNSLSEPHKTLWKNARDKLLEVLRTFHLAINPRRTLTASALPNPIGPASLTKIDIATLQLHSAVP